MKRFVSNRSRLMVIGSQLLKHPFLPIFLKSFQSATFNTLPDKFGLNVQSEQICHNSNIMDLKGPNE